MSFWIRIAFEVFVQLPEGEISTGRNYSFVEYLAVREFFVQMGDVCNLNLFDFLCAERLVEVVVLKTGEEDAEFLKAWNFGCTSGFATHKISKTHWQKCFERHFFYVLLTTKLVKRTKQTHSKIR